MRRRNALANILQGMDTETVQWLSRQKLSSKDIEEDVFHEDHTLSSATVVNGGSANAAQETVISDQGDVDEELSAQTDRMENLTVQHGD